MTLLRLFLWLIIFYLIVRTVRNVMKIFSTQNKNTPQNEVKRQKQSKYRIEKEDVIDAHFEEIETKKNENTKNNP